MELFGQLADVLGANPALAPFLVVLLRFVGVVLAPLPGAPVAFASLALMPWWLALLSNIAGAWLGAVTAFFIARKFREPVVARLAPLRRVQEWQTRLSTHQQLLGFAALRAVSIPAFDFVSYAAGLSAMRFRVFMLATLLVDIPVNLAFFYFGGLAAVASWYLLAVYIASVIVLVVLVARRGILKA
jgi:uncharacterized membrane protein YdjX (TVP38/TMEM64 family)